MPLCNNESKRKISDLETFELINIWTTYRQMTGWVCVTRIERPYVVRVST